MMINRLKWFPVGRIGLALIFLWFAGPNCFAGIPAPPVTIIGSLQSATGLEVTTGDLQFEFIPDGGGTTVRVNATVGSFEGGFNFYVSVPVEVAPLAAGSTALQLGGGKTYTPRVLYQGEEVTPVLITTPYSSSQGDVIGPLNYTVNATGGTFSVSSDLSFGFVEVGSFSEMEFQINNTGTVKVQGTTRLENQVDFSLQAGGVAVQDVTVDLIAGATQAVTVRFAPTLESSLLTDTFVVTTDAGEQTRLVSGDSIVEIPPTATPTPSNTPGPPTATNTPNLPTATATKTPELTKDSDINGDGVVDESDLFLFLLNWQILAPPLPNPEADIDSDGDIDEFDLHRFLADWKK